MPNWCSTKITFTPNKPGALEALNHLYENLMQMQDERQKHKDVREGMIWEVDLEERFNLDIDDYKRGYFDHIDDEQNEDGSFTVFLEDAWGPNLSWWKALLDTMYGVDTIKIVYVAEEEGQAIFCTNDRDELPMYNAYMQFINQDSLQLDKCWNYDANGPFAYMLPNTGMYSTLATAYDGARRYLFPETYYEASIVCDSTEEVIKQLEDIMTPSRFGITGNEETVSEIFDKVNSHFVTDSYYEAPISYSEFEYCDDKLLFAYDINKIKKGEGFHPFCL